MAKLVRRLQKIFGGSLVASNNIAKFGSLRISSPAYSLDPLDIQTTEYLNGWAAALWDNKSPALQDMNALFYLITRQMAYQFQAGIPEYDATTTYYTGSIVNNGYGVIYRSLADDNTGNALSDSTKWVYTRSLARAGLISPYAGEISDAASFRAATGWALCNGDTVLRATYSDLFANIGTAWDLCVNPLTGVQYSAPSGLEIRLPDLRGAFVRGVGSPSGLDAVTLAGWQTNKTSLNGLGNTSHTHSIDHDHSAFNTASGGSHTHTYQDEHSGGSGDGYDGSGEVDTAVTGGTGNHIHTIDIPAFSGTSGASALTGYSETRPNNVGVNYIIKLYNDVW